MAKDVKEKPLSPRSPIAIAKEAMETEYAPPGNVPVLSLNNDILAEVNDELARQARFQLQRMKQNVVDTAQAETEIHKLETLNRLKTAQASVQPVVQPVATQPQLTPIGGSGILAGILGQPSSQSPATPGVSPSPVGPDRVAMIKAALESFESDEARSAFINAHPELFTPSPSISQQMQSPYQQTQSPYQQQSPQPGAYPSYPSPCFQPQPAQQQSASDSISVIQSVSAILTEQLRQGMELQRAVSPPVSQQPQQDILQVATTFKEMQDKSMAVFQNVIKEQQEQNKSLADMITKQKEEYAQKITELEISMRDRDNEHLAQKIAELQDALSTPRRDIPVSELKSLFSQVRDNGIPVNVDTAEQERIRAQTARDNLELEHKFEMEKEQLALQRVREERRADTMRSATTFLGGMFESRAMSKHNLSPNASRLVAGGE